MSWFGLPFLFLPSYLDFDETMEGSKCLEVLLNQWVGDEFSHDAIYEICDGGQLAQLERKYFWVGPSLNENEKHDQILWMGLGDGVSLKQVEIMQRRGVWSIGVWNIFREALEYRSTATGILLNLRNRELGGGGVGNNPLRVERWWFGQNSTVYIKLWNFMLKSNRLSGA